MSAARKRTSRQPDRVWTFHPDVEHDPAWLGYRDDLTVKVIHRAKGWRGDILFSQCGTSSRNQDHRCSDPSAWRIAWFNEDIGQFDDSYYCDAALPDEFRAIVISRDPDPEEQCQQREPDFGFAREDHHITLHPKRGNFTGLFYRAECRCGWQGQIYQSRERAERQGERHVNDLI
jgi:hypothetical protein